MKERRIGDYGRLNRSSCEFKGQARACAIHEFSGLSPTGSQLADPLQSLEDLAFCDEVGLARMESARHYAPAAPSPVGSKMTVNGAAHEDYDVVVAAPFGAIAVHCDAGVIVALDLLARPIASTRGLGGFAAQVTTELEAYLRDARHRVALPVRANGTAFQSRVWERLQRIPAGAVCTYGALAQELRTSARAVGGACRANPVPLVVPCHRVVAASGIGGFAGFREGSMLAIKSWLLEHERNWNRFAGPSPEIS